MGSPGQNKTSDLVPVESSRGCFATTHWSVVLAASQTDAPKGADAMAELCRIYWYPLYVYVRRKGYAAHDAQDLTQEFFARLLARNYLNVADRNKGKFRSFLLGSLEHFLAREWTRSHAQKRGGGHVIFSLDEPDAEKRYLLEPACELAPEKTFDRRWATTLLERALTRLREDYQANNKEMFFHQVECLLTGGVPEGSYAQIAGSLNMSEGALKVAVHRLRQRYGELVRAEIAHTVAGSAEIEDELQYLFAVLRE